MRPCMAPCASKSVARWAREKRRSSRRSANGSGMSTFLFSNLKRAGGVEQIAGFIIEQGGLQVLDQEKMQS